MATYQREWKRLADRLRSMREAAGLSGAVLARELGEGWTQPKVSKIETQRQLPTEDEVREWAHATGGGVAEVLSLLDAARAERTEFRTAGVSAVQADILALEFQATRIGEFQPSMMSGLVQTAEYANEALHIPSGPAAFGASEDDIQSMIATRMQRQRVLYDPAKRVQIVMLESALRVRLCSDATLAGQLDRLLALAGLPAVELTIVPSDVRLPVFPMGFRVYDDDLVIVESISDESRIEDADNVATYVKLFDLLRQAGATGEEAASLIRGAVTDLRRDS